MIKPIGNNILIEQETLEQKTASGFVLPTENKNKPNMGRVIAQGDEVKRDYKDKRVLFVKYGPNEITFEKEEYLICKEQDLLAIVE